MHGILSVELEYFKSSCVSFPSILQASKKNNDGCAHSRDPHLRVVECAVAAGDRRAREPEASELERPVVCDVERSVVRWAVLGSIVSVGAQEEARDGETKDDKTNTYPWIGLSCLGFLGAAFAVGRSERDRHCVSACDARRSVATRLPWAPARRLVASITRRATRTGNGSRWQKLFTSFWRKPSSFGSRKNKKRVPFKIAPSKEVILSG